MPDTMDIEMKLAFAQMSKSSALNKLYAKKVKREGNTLLSRLLNAISRSENVHARRSLLYIRGKLVKPTEYLESLLHLKHENASIKYPKIARLSIDEEKKKASEAYDQFSKVEKIHLKLLKEALEGSTNVSATYHVCQICGYIAVDEIPPKCPVCNAVREKFRTEE